MPITPDKILKALEERAKGREARVGPNGIPQVEFPKPIKVEPPEGAPKLERRKRFANSG